MKSAHGKGGRKGWGGWRQLPLTGGDGGRKAIICDTNDTRNVAEPAFALSPAKCKKCSGSHGQ